MGRRVFTVPGYEKELMLSFYHEPVDKERAAQASFGPSERRAEPVTCEFSDYCNHLYYCDGRCDCTASWKRTTGLVLPASA